MPQSSATIIPFRPPRRRRPGIVRTVAPSFAVLIVTAIAVVTLPSLIDPTDSTDISAASGSDLPGTSDPASMIDRTFRLCGRGGGANCVIDGDTFRFDGRKIRIAGIDAPEIHPSRCDREERLGQAAKLRLLDLLNAGSFELRASGRDHDHYGRDLRDVYRGGTSLGDTLVQEGLAHPWTGHHLSWCE